MISSSGGTFVLLVDVGLANVLQVLLRLLCLFMLCCEGAAVTLEGHGAWQSALIQISSMARRGCKLPSVSEIRFQNPCSLQVRNLFRRGDRRFRVTEVFHSMSEVHELAEPPNRRPAGIGVGGQMKTMRLMKTLWLMRLLKPLRTQ